jgi:hypothetical protein
LLYFDAFHTLEKKRPLAPRAQGRHASKDKGTTLMQSKMNETGAGRRRAIVNSTLFSQR